MINKLQLLARAVYAASHDMVSADLEPHDEAAADEAIIPLIEAWLEADRPLEYGYGHEHLDDPSVIVPITGFADRFDDGRYADGRSRETAEKQMHNDLRWRTPLHLMERESAGPWRVTKEEK